MSAAPQRTEAPAPPMVGKKEPRAIKLDRVINLAHATGEPKQVVIENDIDPADVLADMRYWQELGTRDFPVGAKFELTNDAGSFLWEVWIRAVHGNVNSGIRHIRFHHRPV